MKKHSTPLLGILIGATIALSSLVAYCGHLPEMIARANAIVVPDPKYPDPPSFWDLTREFFTFGEGPGFIPGAIILTWSIFAFRQAGHTADNMPSVS